MNVQINVTQQDIDEGKPMMQCACPIWRAIKRMVLDDVEVVVDGVTAGVGIGNTWVLLYLPFAAHEFVAEFDFGDPVQPFSFDPDIPERFLRKAA